MYGTRFISKQLDSAALNKYAFWVKRDGTGALYRFKSKVGECEPTGGDP